MNKKPVGTPLKYKRSNVRVAAWVLGIVSVCLLVLLALSIMKIHSLKRELSALDSTAAQETVTDTEETLTPTETAPVTEPATEETAETTQTPPPTTQLPPPPPPTNTVLLDVPYISQIGTYPNGCEAVSATMVLRYMGYGITEKQFIDDYLKKGPLYRDDEGVLWGPDPNMAYAGDPASQYNGCGCFAPVIESAMSSVVAESIASTEPGEETMLNSSVKNITGTALSELEKYLDMGYPIVVWGTLEMTDISRYIEWRVTDTEDTVKYPANEHCLVLIGYDDSTYTFADPLKKENGGRISYPKEQVEVAYTALGRQAVVVVNE